MQIASGVFVGVDSDPAPISDFCKEALAAAMRSFRFRADLRQLGNLVFHKRADRRLLVRRDPFGNIISQILQRTLRLIR